MGHMARIPKISKYSGKCPDIISKSSCDMCNQIHASWSENSLENRSEQAAQEQVWGSDRDGVRGTRSRIIGARCGMRIGQNRERICRSEVRIAIMGSDRGHGSDRDVAITSRVWS